MLKMKNATIAAAITLAWGLGQAAQAEPVKVGLMLPATGTYAALGKAIENGFKLYVDEQGGKLGGQEVQYFAVDDESDPAKAPENTNRLVQRDKVDVLVGTVHSGVAMGMAKIARDSGVIYIIPNAGADMLTGPLCAKNIFRSSFTNWQPAYGMGIVAAEKQKHKTAVTINWKYAAGTEAAKGFREGFESKGGKVVKELTLPFPNVEFQSLLTEISSLKPDAVFAFFAGGGAVKFVKDYDASGLRKTIPLYGPGFLTDGTLEAQGDAAKGMLTTLHYADELDNPKDKAFRKSYQAKFNMEPDVYAVQGYDAAQLLAAGLDSAKGDIKNKDAVIQGMEQAKVDSPRGPFTMSRAHNPVQNIYLREVVGKHNKNLGIAVANLEDPAKGCKLDK